MKLGILGSGKIVAEVLDVLNDIREIEIVAIAARNEDKLKDIVSKYPIGRYYLSVDELVNDNDVEVVYVALPNNLHFDAMKKAIEAGKDIICEKPFTSNLKEALEIKKLADEKGVLVVEAISHRFIPNAIKAREKIAGLGDIKIVSFNYSQYSSRYDDFLNDKIASAFSAESSGGALVDLNLYNLAYAVDTFGKPKDIKYFANIDKGIDTSGILILDYGDFKASLIGSKDSAAPISNTIQGSKGTIDIPDAINSFSSYNIKMVKEDESQSFNFNDPSKSRLYYEFIEFVDIFAKRDREKIEEFMDKTLAYMEVLSKARLDAKIIFPADKI